MGQKVHPVGFRLGIIKTWKSRWFATKGYADTLHEDLRLRRFIKERVYHAGVSSIDILEVRKAELDAQLIAEQVASQLMRRVAFRRAMKKTVQSTMRLGAQGVQIACAGRLAGAEIARREWYREGRMPLNTLRADIDYGFTQAKTTYGLIGVKCWVFQGEVLPETLLAKQEREVPSLDRLRRPRGPAPIKG